MKKTRTFTKDYDDFACTLWDKAGLKKKPIFVQFELTFRCNLKCVHCYAAEEPAKKELTFVEITHILDRIQQENCLHLCFTGGEPLLREDFLDIYTYAVKKGFLVTLFTNATLITPEIASYLEEYPPFRVEISLNGLTAETFHKITQVPGSFDRCTKGINLIRKRKIPLTIKTVGMNLNRNEVLQIKKFAEKSLGASFKYDSIIVPRIDGSKEPCRFRLSPSEITEIEYSDQDMRKQRKESIESHDAHFDPEALFYCGAGTESFNINPYGELGFCHLLREPSFNLRRNSLKEFNQLFCALRSTKYRTHFECRDCQDRHLCPRCPAIAQLECGNMEQKMDYFCELAQLRKESNKVLVSQNG